MGILDVPIRSVAKSLIDQFGTAVTITRVTPGTYNPNSGRQAETTSTTSPNAVVSQFKHHETADTDIRVTDRKLLVPAADVSFTPDVDDRVVIATRTYRIVSIREIQATDQAAVYELACRYDG